MTGAARMIEVTPGKWVNPAYLAMAVLWAPDPESERGRLWREQWHVELMMHDASISLNVWRETEGEARELLWKLGALKQIQNAGS